MSVASLTHFFIFTIVLRYPASLFKTIFIKVHLFQQMRLSVYMFTRYYFYQPVTFHHKQLSLQMFVGNGLIHGNYLENLVRITKNGIV